MRRGGFTNLSIAVVDEDEDLLEFDDIEDEEAVSATTSLERRRAVFLALVMNNASATDKMSKNNVAIFTRWR
jgi:hypothetical protein